MGNAACHTLYLFLWTCNCGELMDYLKEFQAFAGRFSAAAEDKLASVDGGTYNEFFRFYSQSWPAEVGVHTGLSVQAVVRWFRSCAPSICLASPRKKEILPHLIACSPPCTDNSIGLIASGLPSWTWGIVFAMFYASRRGVHCFTNECQLFHVRRRPPLGGLSDE